MNLDAYLARIGWTGRRTAAPDVLAGLLAAHMRAIPFENLDVLLGTPPSLELDKLEAKLVGARRGGYCYEHATLFSAALRELGFAVKAHSARVVMMTPRELAPRTHMFLTVGDVMLDPGFGGLAPRVPVALDGTAAGSHRLVRDGDVVALEHAGQRLWVSSLEHDMPIDFVMANHFTATHESSPFVMRLMLRAFTPDGEVRVMNRAVTHTRGAEKQSYELADRGALRELLAAQFGFDLPQVERLRVPAIPEWT